MKKYELFIQDEIVDKYSCFEQCIYSFFKLISNVKNSNLVKINVMNNKMIIDVLSIKQPNEFMEIKIASLYKSTTYSFCSIQQLHDFLCLYSNEKTIISENLFALYFLINNVNLFNENKCTTTKKTDEIYNVEYNGEKEKTKKIVIKKEENKMPFVDRLAELELKLTSQSKLNVNKKDDSSVSSYENNNNISSKPTIEKIPSLEINKRYNFDGSSSSSSSSSCTDSELTSLDEFNEFCNENLEIYEMEKTKEKIKDIIKNVGSTVEKEDFDLAIYAGEIDQERILKQKEKEKLEDKMNQFRSQKNFTYKKIYEDFFTNKKIPSWEDIPSLFSANFAIFLYLDGKDNNGNNVRDRILDTEDEYRIYNLLLQALTDDTFEIPEEDEFIITDFLYTLPPINLLSSDKIMKSYNDPENELFENDVTSLNSADGDDHGNYTYN
jgi:hypothetical protein